MHQGNFESEVIAHMFQRLRRLDVSLLKCLPELQLEEQKNLSTRPFLVVVIGKALVIASFLHYR
jgi:hypothetical protein